MFQKWNDVVSGCVQTVNGNEVATLSCIPAIFANLLSALLAFAGTAALVLFLLGSFKFMKAGGDPKKIESSRNTFSFAIMGFSIVLASFLLINIISAVTGVGCIKNGGFGFVCR